MKNLGQLMKQAQEMQSRMADLQQQMEGHEVTGIAGGGMVEVTLNGKGDMRRIKVDPALLSADEVTVMEDLIVAAHHEAKIKAEAAMAEKMSELTGGLQLPPGMKLPF